MRCVALAVEYDTHMHASTDIYFNALRADVDKHVQVLEIVTIAFDKFSHVPPLIWAQIVLCAGGGGGAPSKAAASAIPNSYQSCEKCFGAFNFTHFRNPNACRRAAVRLSVDDVSLR